MGSAIGLGLKLRSLLRLASLAGVLMLAAPAPLVAFAADLGAAPAIGDEVAPMTLHEALSRYLSLEMIRATFDVVNRDDLGALLEEQAVRWQASPPSTEALADLDQQLLTEASYYLVSLNYLVQVGGAVFPSDKSEMVYANDTVARLESLRRELVDAVESGGDVVPILVEAEEIRALTEGYGSVPADFGVFTTHDTLFDAVLDKLERGTST